MNRQLKFEIHDSSQIGGARRAAQDLAARIGLDETRTGQIAIAIAELGTNLLKHARGGEILLRALGDAPPGLEIMSIDRGPGMADVSSSMRDGFSTTGTMGAGLGSISRLATEFDVYSAPGKGTVIRTQFGATAKGASALNGMDIGAICLPKAGETECGDDWTFTRQERRHMFLLADGLGHGPDAHKAALVAVQVIRKKGAQEPGAVLDDIHAASRATRGAAVSICAIEHDTGVCRFAGIGNVACAVVSDGRARQFASHSGIVGHSVRKIQEFSAPWPAAGLLVMHSDGLGTQWNIGNYPGLQARHPGVVAGVLYRDFTRGRDDVTVLVARDSKHTA